MTTPPTGNPPRDLLSPRRMSRALQMEIEGEDFFDDSLLRSAQRTFALMDAEQAQQQSPKATALSGQNGQPHAAAQPDSSSPPAGPPPGAP